MLVLLTVAGLPVYVFPPSSAPHQADVVLVLGPPDPWRITWGQQLVHDGTAGHLLISVANPADRPVCSQAGVTCFRPDPWTTRGEARHLRQAMAENGWTTAIVITTTPHVERSRYILGRCVADGVQVVGRAPGGTPWWWAYEYLYQTAGWLRASTQTGC